MLLRNAPLLPKVLRGRNTNEGYNYVVMRAECGIVTPKSLTTLLNATYATLGMTIYQHLHRIETRSES